MSESHTPGPWYAYSPLASGVHAGYHYKVANSQPIGICEDEDGSIVPHFPEWNANSRIVCTTTDDEYSRANARLIAAAPTMLEALRTVRDLVGFNDVPREEIWRTIDAAIAKAGGAK